MASNAKRRLLKSVFFSFFAVYFSLSFRTEAIWPFVPYNMFRRMLQPKLNVVAVRLRDNKNHSQIVGSGNVFPLEDFRAEYLSKLFGRNDVSEEIKTSLAEVILQRLNTDSWTARPLFQRKSATDRMSGKFIQIEFFDQEVDLAKTLTDSPLDQMKTKPYEKPFYSYSHL